MITYSKEEYEKSRPAGEQKLDFPDFVVRAYVDEEGSLHVLMHKRSEDGCEQLPLAYMLGHNAATLTSKKANERELNRKVAHAATEKIYGRNR